MDAISSFSVVLYYCGAALYVAAICYLLLPLFQAWDQTRSDNDIHAKDNSDTSESDQGSRAALRGKCANRMSLKIKQTLLPAAKGWKG
ncbi:hypothetical protein ElyMa_003403500 [Elysia marginata]|uniref:Uncharacterized protein n=1 Tax=Elysia marginata TaxID=1093978 RepID=A0AAV4JNK3_9GAST|nr:hypothetical protein ElyMa_003403500 [Elysia marginata]